MLLWILCSHCNMLCSYWSIALGHIGPKFVLFAVAAGLPKSYADMGHATVVRSAFMFVTECTAPHLFLLTH